MPLAGKTKVQGAIQVVRRLMKKAAHIRYDFTIPRVMDSQGNIDVVDIGIHYATGPFDRALPSRLYNTKPSVACSRSLSYIAYAKNPRTSAPGRHTDPVPKVSPASRGRR